MKLIWYGHSCFKLDSADGSVVFDPYAPGSVPGLAMPALTADAVICSHGHGDHDYAAGVTLTGRTPTFTVQYADCFHDETQGSLRGRNRISVVCAEGLRIAHLGDLGHKLTPAQLAVLGAVDVLMIPVGGYYTIDAAQAHAIVDAVKPRITVPMHYRGDGFGYDVIAPIGDFLRLCNNVRYADGSTLTLPADDAAGTTVVLKCPLAE